ncbi:hypothetical protein J1605_019060 [Eschrichtius robustus]|uniref:Cadherin domain-containing protein n=1 Tax=Eschrichtius robustus TaxID=9764 RepID=A0AB34HR43_ESCRO|nr:hypothetical protein J1605_019060 [Eschrichtius robustus]
MQGTRVRALVWEDPTCRGATGPMCDFGQDPSTIGGTLSICKTSLDFVIIFSPFIFLTGNPLLTSRVNILINVLDVNEFPPEISVPYETAVCENAKPGQIIQIVSAADRDLSPAGQQFSFKLSPEAAIKPNFTVRDFRSKFNHIKIYPLSCNFVKGHKCRNPCSS